MFRTELSLRPNSQLLSLTGKVLTIGSCFSDVIGQRLATHKVQTLVNPFGTVFNPLAAARLLRAAAGEETYWQQHFVEARGRWQSYDLHATIGADSPPALLERIEQVTRETAEFVRSADVLVWTLGTAFAYRLRDTGELVNNCHKVPGEQFEKELLTAEEIVTAVTEAYAMLRRQNPRLRLVLTVSPVRHLKDTLPLNAVSKSVLRVACHYLSELLPDATYFPSYELLLDDLRDYRFYGADMIHPSEVAEQYVWDKFIGTYFDAAFGDFVYEWAAIQRALAHRPLHLGAPEHRHFLEQTQKRLERLADRVDVRAELRDVHKRIISLPPPKPVALPEPEDDEERIDIGEGSVAAAKPIVAAPELVVEAYTLPEPELSADEAHEQAEEQDAAGTLVTDDASVPKRRKRKRGGRKHRKKGGAAGEAELGEVELIDQPQPTPIADSPSLSQAMPEVPSVAPAMPVEVPEVSPEAAANGPKRRGRPAPKRGRPVAAESDLQPTASPEEPQPVVAAEAPVPAEPAPAPEESQPAAGTGRPKRANASRPVRSLTPRRTSTRRAPDQAAEPGAAVLSPVPEPERQPEPAKPAARRRATPRPKRTANAGLDAPATPETPPAGAPVPSTPDAEKTAPTAAKRRGRPPRRKPDSAPDAS